MYGMNIWRGEVTDKNCALETVYKVAICLKGNIPYKQIYFINGLKFLLNGTLGQWNTYFIGDFTL